MMIPPVVSNIRPGSIVTRSKLLPTTNVPPPADSGAAPRRGVRTPEQPQPEQRRQDAGPP